MYSHAPPPPDHCTPYHMNKFHTKSKHTRHTEVHAPLPPATAHRTTLQHHQIQPFRSRGLTKTKACRAHLAANSAPPPFPDSLRPLRPCSRRPPSFCPSPSPCFSPSLPHAQAVHLELAPVLPQSRSRHGDLRHLAHGDLRHLAPPSSSPSQHAAATDRSPHAGAATAGR